MTSSPRKRRLRVVELLQKHSGLFTLVLHNIRQLKSCATQRLLLVLEQSHRALLTGDVFCEVLVLSVCTEVGCDWNGYAVGESDNKASLSCRARQSSKQARVTTSYPKSVDSSSTPQGRRHHDRRHAKPLSPRQKRKRKVAEEGRDKQREDAQGAQGLILAFLLQCFSPYLSPSLLFSFFLLSFAPAPSPVLSLCTHYYHLFAQAGESADLCSVNGGRAFSVLPFSGREKGALFRTEMYK